MIRWQLGGTRRFFTTKESNRTRMETPFLPLDNNGIACSSTIVWYQVYETSHNYIDIRSKHSLFEWLNIHTHTNPCKIMSIICTDPPKRHFHLASGNNRPWLAADNDHHHGT